MEIMNVSLISMHVNCRTLFIVAISQFVQKLPAIGQCDSVFFCFFFWFAIVILDCYVRFNMSHFRRTICDKFCCVVDREIFVCLLFCVVKVLKHLFYFDFCLECIHEQSITFHIASFSTPAY